MGKRKSVAPRVRRDDRPSSASTAVAAARRQRRRHRRRRRPRLVGTIFLKAACFVSGIPLRVAATFVVYIAGGDKGDLSVLAEGAWRNKLSRTMRFRSLRYPFASPPAISFRPLIFFHLATKLKREKRRGIERAREKDIFTRED